MSSFLALGFALAAAPSIDEPPISGARAPNDYAVVIANQDYSGLSDVAYATRDADAFSAWLTRTRGLSPVNVIRLNGATRKRMEDAVQRAAQSVPKGGTLWVYYTGHGLGVRVGGGASERVLVGINAVATADEISENVVSLAALQRVAGASPAARAVFVIDACFNNKDASGDVMVRGSFAVPAGRAAVVPKVTVWTASSEDETARWYEPARHGAFTYFAVGALSGWADGSAGPADGEVTLDEAQDWTRRAMSSAGILDQNPEIAGDATLAAVRGKLAPAPATGFGADEGRPSGVPGASSGGFGFDGDLSAQLKAQACEEEAGRLAEKQAAARGEAAAAKVRSEATAAWGRLKLQLEACSKLDDRIACVAMAQKFIAAGKAAKVDLAAGVETVTTACGQKSRAVAARTVAVPVAEVADAEAWLGRLSGPAAGEDGRSPTLGVLKWVPPGTFTMGSPAGEWGRFGDEVQHQVTLTRGFQMMATEVTQGMYRQLIGSNPSRNALRDLSLLGDDLPVQNVSWVDAVTYANAASKAEGLTACYAISGDSTSWTRGCTGYRLPTEAEWERAARGGGTQVFAGTSEASGVCGFDNVLNPSVNAALDWDSETFSCEDGAVGPAQVGSYRANGYGLHDMGGNVSEWAWDWYGDYPGAVTDPSGSSSGSGRVYRGGSWAIYANYTRVATRLHVDPNSRDFRHGFRLVRSVP